MLNQGTVPNLRFYRKGIYYLTTTTPFGELPIDKQQLIADKYLAGDSGYETGMQLLYRLGLTTQLPNEQLIATNAAHDCVRDDKTLAVRVCPPKIPITAGNKHYLQTLDALDLLDKAPITARDPHAIIAAFIRDHHLQYETLLHLADKYYNQKTVLHLARTAGLKGAAA